MTLILLNALAPVFFTLALGWLAGSRAIIDNRNVSSLNLTLMNFSLPASLFVAMARTPFSKLREDGLVIMGLALAMCGTYGVTWWCQRAIFRRSRQEAAVQSLTVAFPNCAAIGLPLLASVYPPSSSAIAAIGIAVGAVLISPLTLAILESEQASENKQDELHFVRAIGRSFRRPIVLAPIFGVIVSVTGLGLNDTVSRVFLLFGQGAAGLALFLTGLILSAQPFRISLDMSLGVILKNIMQPLGLFLIARLLRVPSPAAAEATLLAAVPAGFFGTVFASRFKVESPEASATLIVSTLSGLITLSIAVILLHSL
jgi:predicted permease